MRSNQSDSRVGRLSTVLGTLTIVSLVFVPALLAQDWVEYADESTTRISAASGVGTMDPEEKDIFPADVDNDGDMDLLIVRKEPFSTMGGHPNVLFMNEHGIMVDRTAALAPDFLDVTDTRDVVLVDVDGDTWGDIVTVTTFSDQPRVHMNLGRNPDGVWLGFDYVASDNRLPTFSPAPKFCAVGFGDVTGDDRPDLFFVDYDNDLEDRLLINDGNGFFTDETDTRMTSTMSFSEFGTDAHIVDADGDGDNDIVKNTAIGCCGVDNHVSVLYNDGTGNFDFDQRISEDSVYMIEPADWTGDGKIDWFLVDDFQDHFLVHNGLDVDDHVIYSSGTVTSSPTTQGFGGNVKIHDLDADGLMDVLVADVDTDLPGCNRRMAALRGSGTLPNVGFSDPLNGNPRSWLPTGVFDLDAFDIDKDGNLDLWLGTCTGNEVHMNTSGPGLFIGDFEDGVGRWSNCVGSGCPAESRSLR